MIANLVHPEPATAQLSRITVRSGGQTGADFGFIHGAKMMGATTAGWIPRGWLTEEGPMPWLEVFGLRETPEAGYPQRTSWNVRDAEVTILFGDPTSRGSRLTIECCEMHARPILRIPWDPSKPADPSDARAAAIVAWLRKHGATHINGAGNRESVAPGITVAADRLIRAVLARL